MGSFSTTGLAIASRFFFVALERGILFFCGLDQGIVDAYALIVCRLLLSLLS
jgi:hypothetical protein